MTLERKSHEYFFSARDWHSVQLFWNDTIQKSSLPSYLLGDDDYGLTNLLLINLAGVQEFNSNEIKYKRKTFALRLSYDGSCYYGFQCQKDVKTVESDIKSILGRNNMAAAGRTDRGNV